MGCVGADDAGRDQIASLRAENVDVEFVRTVEGAGTQWASIILVDGGTDSLMRGDEEDLGTPVEDMAW